MANLHYLRNLFRRRRVYDEEQMLGVFGLVGAPIAASVMREIRVFSRDILLPYNLNKVCPCSFHVRA